MTGRHDCQLRERWPWRPGSWRGGSTGRESAASALDGPDLANQAGGYVLREACPETSPEALGEMSEVLRVTWYRLATTFARRRSGYLSLVVLIGLIGGVAMASAEAGRRTQSSYATFLTSTNPSDLTLSVGSTGSAPVLFSSRSVAVIAHLPDVKRVAALITPAMVPLRANGTPDLTGGSGGNNVQALGSDDGMWTDIDRVTVIKGRMANPEDADEAVMTPAAAAQGGAYIGQVLDMGYYTAAQLSSKAFGTPRVAPALKLDIRLVGIVVLNRQVVEDDVDSTSGFVIFTPALIRAVAAVSPGGQVTLAPGAPTLYGLQLEHGSRDLARVEGEVVDASRPGSAFLFNATSRVVAQVELALKPESVAFGAFGVIAGLVALLVGLQAISRQLRWDEEDRRVLRALGAGPAMAGGDGLIGVLAAVVVGALLAAALAVALSPLAPLGPVRPVYPDRGIAFDWTVLGVGVAVLVGVLGAGAALLAFSRAPHRAARSRGLVAARPSSLASRAQSAGMPVAGVVGVRFALEPGQGRTSVPVRSAIVGTVLAVAVGVSALTFASSLTTLVSHPPLYGWNWDYMFDTTNDVPPQSLKALDRDPDVAAWSGANLTPFQVDGQFVPSIEASPHARVAPPVLSGHGLEANNEILLGAATLAELHKRVGDTVYLSEGTPRSAPFYIPPTPLVVVGTTTFPAIGYSSIIASQPSMGTGALVSSAVEPPAWRRAETSSDPILNGPQYVFVRLAKGVSAKNGLANLNAIANKANQAINNDPQAAGDDGVSVLGVLRPAQIVNYRTIGATPLVLAAGLAAGAVLALGLTLTASVRRRRRDLALLKALGFTQGQLSAAIAWQATVAALIGVLVGTPLGIVAGRELWILFAHNLNAVPDPTTPALSVFLVAIGALVFANLVAALPGRTASRTPTGLVLRAE
ncbi:MAG: ABC transporter permease [Acidimicrobiales bacterium]